MRERDRFARIEARLGWRFRDRTLLRRALTHPSAIAIDTLSYQRLEFLGDRVLGLLIADALFSRFGEASEGVLALRYNQLVNRKSCAAVARAIALGEAVVLSAGEARTGGARKRAILADSMEALIGAAYLDGGIEAAKSIVLRHWGAAIEGAASIEPDPKTRLQEWSQARHRGLPQYSLLETSGPAHAPTFLVEVRLCEEEGRQEAARARASTRRAAEQCAASHLLHRLEGGN